jgi:omega-6 fatty acid desaturase (delta-12 desaturase)
MTGDGEQDRLTPAGTGAAEFDGRALRRATQTYEGGDLGRSVWQLVNSFGPFVALCAAMYLSLDRSYWLTLAIGVVAAGFMVRIFIIQHDCGHDSFFRSRRANTIVGTLCSLVTFTPYANWRRQHAGHHGHWNNLDKRDSGADIYSSCLTVEEYQGLSRWRRIAHRIVQHPVVALVIVPPLVFLLVYRVPFDTPKSWRKERFVVYATNMALLGAFLLLGWGLGFRNVLLVQLPIVAIAATIGVWLFSVQHRFERSWWAEQDEWDVVTASLQGSSYLKLPRLLQWFTGNIGFHHVHHLNPRIPNYRLQECHEALPELQDATTLTLSNGLRAWLFGLWDRDRNRMVRFTAL